MEEGPRQSKTHPLLDVQSEAYKKQERDFNALDVKIVSFLGFMGALIGLGVFFTPDVFSWGLNIMTFAAAFLVVALLTGLFSIMTQNTHEIDVVFLLEQSKSQHTEQEMQTSIIEHYTEVIQKNDALQNKKARLFDISIVCFVSTILLLLIDVLLT